jgi:hypothetical protein
MKIIKLMNNSEYFIEEEDLKVLEKIIYNPNITFIKLNNGNLINKTSISEITDIKKVAYWREYKLCKDEVSFIREGKKVYLDTKDLENIYYIEDKEITKKQNFFKIYENDKLQLN